MRDVPNNVPSRKSSAFWRSSIQTFSGYKLCRLSSSRSLNNLFNVSLKNRLFSEDSSSPEDVRFSYNLYASALLPFSSKAYIKDATSVPFLRSLYGMTSAGVTSNEVFRGNISAETFVDHLQTIASAAVICEDGAENGTSFVDSISDEKQKFKEYCADKDNWDCINREILAAGGLWSR